jgi:hypothetical protein
VDENQITHCLWALVAAVIGGVIAHFLFADSGDDGDRPAALPQRDRLWSARRWRRPAFVWLTGLALITVSALAGAKASPGLWAGVVFMLTCGMLGLAVLGALAGRDGRRTIWLGVALFGAGYMYYTFGRTGDDGSPYPPTTHLLNALRPGSPPHSSGFPDSSARWNARSEQVLLLLEEPIPMHFADGATLEEILKLPAYEDPFLIVGHCLLALVAAGIGGVLAPVVADRRGE